MALTQIINAGIGSSNTVTSEGGNVTTSLQQGLCKAWVNFDGTGTIAERDSFNIGANSSNLAALTDNGTGDYTVSYTNIMNNSNYSAQVTGAFTDTGVTSSSTPFTCRSLTDSSMRAVGVGTANNALDMIRMCVSIQGDLA